MADRINTTKRSENMSRIRSGDTKPELIVRSLLHRSGLRYSLRRPDLPGKPDIVLSKYRAVVFVHGCFWHRHKGCREASTPKTRTEFWSAKFEQNVERDRRNQRALRKLGWNVMVVWECEVMRDPLRVVSRIRRALGLESYIPENKGQPYEIRRQALRLAEAKLRWRLGDAGTDT